MNIHPRSSHILFVCGLVLVGVLMGLLVSDPVQADVGVQPILPGGSSIRPGEETPIQMAAEVVTMNIRPATEADNTLVVLAPKTYGLQGYPVWYPGIAEVEANFTMRNPTSEAVSLTAWFPLASALENADWNLNPGEIVPRLEKLQVSVDGNPVGYAVSELPNPKGSDKPPLPWASFPVTFPGEAETVIHVSYMLPLQPSAKGYEMALYYIFQTGAGWAGPIGKAELILNLPYPASEETLAGRRTLYLPPTNVGQKSAGVPSGAVLDGNQARWTWKDFEPGPEDDFAVWLLQPGKWQELETARAAVQANPKDGQAWLDLATTYHSLSLTWTNAPLLFSSVYLPPGLLAYQKAADLLPDHPAAHAGLALFTLLPYLKDKNAPPGVIKTFQGEYHIATDLAAKNPALAKEAGWVLEGLEEALYSYYYNDATATMDAATRAAYNVTETARATIEYATRTVWAFEKYAGGTAWAIAKATYLACWTTSGVECTVTASPTTALTPKLALTATPLPTTTPQPPPTFSPTISPTPSPITAETTGNAQRPVIIVAAGVIGLIIGGYLLLRRIRGSAG